MTHRHLKTAACVATVALLAAACGSSSKSVGSTGSVKAAGNSGASASAPGITKSDITLGLVTSLTGPAAANFIGAQQGAAARIAVQNAAGGVNGRQIKLVVGDDQSTPAGATTAVGDLIDLHKVFGLLFVSDLVSSGYRTATQDKVPVVGAPIDGPEWGTQPNTNMISIDGNQAPVNPPNTLLAEVAKEAGADNMAALAIGNEPTSITGAQSFVTGAKSVGLKVGYEDYSIPIGSVDVTSVVLAMKQAHVDGFDSEMLDNTNFALMQTAKQSGLKLVAPIQLVGYDQALLTDPSALAAAQGAIFELGQVPVEEKTPATVAEQAAFAKYERFTGIPNLNWTYGWISADLAIKGLEAAGKNPTRSSFLTATRAISGYTAGGLLPRAIDLSLADFGKSPTTSCAYFAQLKGKLFVPLNKGKPVCGTVVKS
jgi:branched-chain amino acid transport system substrate-binding protein